MNKKILVFIVMGLLFLAPVVSANPDYLNRSVNEVIFPEYTFTHLTITDTLNPQSDGVLTLGEPALRFKDGYFSGVLSSDQLVGYLDYSYIDNFPADLADGDNDTVLTEADITSMGFSKDVDTNETTRVNNLVSQSTAWDQAYSWGDHAVEGYLTAESDPVFLLSAAATINDPLMDRWNEAYGWGDHNLVGYLVSETDPVWSAEKAD